MIRLQESFTISGKDFQNKEPITESTSKLFEEINGKKLECIASYRVPISRFNWKNENGRIYSKELWENVIKNQKHIWEGSIGLADHPGDMDEGSVKNTFAVYHNLGLNEAHGTVDADIHLVGPYGKLAHEIMEAGGKIGFSSSGFGELMEDGSTVDPSSYMLERVSDFVLNPSQKVFGTGDMRKESKESAPMNESTISTGRKVSKLEERKFRKDVEGFLQEASLVAKPADRLIELKELLNYFEDDTAKDLKEKVLVEIKNAETLLGVVQSEQLKLKETFGVDSVEALKEGVSKIINDTQLFERQSKDWKKIAEGLQTKFRAFQKQVESLPTVDQYSALESKLVRMKKFIAQREQLSKNKIDALREELDTSSNLNERMNEEFVSLQKKMIEYKKAVIEGSNIITVLEKTIQKKNKEIQLIVEENTSLVSSANKLPEIKPRYSERVSPLLDMTERNKVASYYKDLENRHGKAILFSKNRILGCKTLNEAMKVYVNLLSEMNTSRISDEITEGRKELVETATGKTILEGHSMKSRLPATWV